MHTSIRSVPPSAVFCCRLSTAAILGLFFAFTAAISGAHGSDWPNKELQQKFVLIAGENIDIGSDVRDVVAALKIRGVRFEKDTVPPSGEGRSTTDERVTISALILYRFIGPGCYIQQAIQLDFDEANKLADVSYVEDMELCEQ